MSVAVLVPVLDRPASALPLVRSLRATCDAQIVFLVQRHDRRERLALACVQATQRNVRVEVVPFPHGRGNYARKINHGVDVTDTEWVLQAADDLAFHKGWLEEALAVAATSGASVIGTNDLCNPRTMSGRHSTHSLVRRDYIMERGLFDESGKMLHEGYWHNFCDDELVHTAIRRGEFAAASRSHVEHLHPNCGKAERDRTYDVGLNTQRFAEDRQLFRVRQALVYGKRPVAGRRAR